MDDADLSLVDPRAPVLGAAIVTGAAGGMGQAIARVLAQQGRALVVSDLHAEPLERLAAELRPHAEVDVVAGDVNDALHRETVVAALHGRPLAVLAHAAGVSPTMADGRRIFAINFTATQRLVEAALPRMARGGVAVLIASNSGQIAASWLIDRVVKRLVAGRASLLASLLLRDPRLAYPLSKRAVQLYVPRMAPAFGERGARIVSLSPGMIDTSMGRQERAAQKMMEKMLAVTPARRMGDAREIAAVVAFLASPAASYISGTDILVDGGTVAGVAAAGGVMKL
jgi:NAD(P)-dependent dehydrogenase (short-subunit alcohol dehydrogenase family)